MPRPRNPLNEVHRSAQERWRDRIRSAGRPEVDLVDSAITVAAAIFTDSVKDKPETSPAWQRANALQRLAANYLVAMGKDRDEVVRMVYKRLHPQNVARLAAIADDTVSTRDRHTTPAS